MSENLPMVAPKAASESPMVIGLRVTNVQAALDFYGSIGFERSIVVPNAKGEPMFCAMRYGSSNLVFDGVESEMPFLDNQRERNMKQGPRGLGVKVGLAVPDVEPIYQLFKAAGCEIITEPIEQFWCERLFIALDPFGYEWQFTQGFKPRPFDEQVVEAQKAWHPLKQNAIFDIPPKLS